MVGRGLTEFEEMQQCYIAIKDIDSVIESDSGTKLEDAWNVISEISKDKFGSKYVDSMLQNIRDALIEIFKQDEMLLNQSVGINL